MATAMSRVALWQVGSAVHTGLEGQVDLDSERFRNCMVASVDTRCGTTWHLNALECLSDSKVSS